MFTFEVTAYDEMSGQVDVLTVRASTLDNAINQVEGDPKHEYEIIDIERV